MMARGADDASNAKNVDAIDTMMRAADGASDAKKSIDAIDAMMARDADVGNDWRVGVA